MTDLFSDLKQHTAASHQALESTFPFNTMLKPESFSTQSYTDNLMILASFHQYVAQKMKQNPQTKDLEALLQSCATVEAIVRDLDQLGIPSPAQHFDAGLASDNMADMVAAAYVWMGSSMGAKILHHWLQQNDYDHLPTHYYAHMRTLGRQWRPFMERAQTLAEQHSISQQRCVDSANALFNELIAGAGRCTPHDR